MRANKVEEEHKHGGEVVSGIKRTKSLFGLVPRLELLVKGLDEVAGDVITEGLNANVLCAQRLHRLLVGAVAVRNDGGRAAGQSKCGMQERERLRRVSVRREMELQDKAGFGIDDEPEVMLSAGNHNDSLVGVPLIRIEIQRWNQLQGDVLKERCKACTLVGNGGVRDRDIVQQTHHERNSAE